MTFDSIEPAPLRITLKLGRTEPADSALLEAARQERQLIVREAHLQERMAALAEVERMATYRLLVVLRACKESGLFKRSAPISSLIVHKPVHTDGTVAIRFSARTRSIR